MKESIEDLRKFGVKHPLIGEYGTGLNGMFIIPSPTDSKRKLLILSSDGELWDHVSVTMHSPKGRCPNWPEMAFVKDLFFKKDETVIQFHPKESEYVNNHNTCLHLWRDQTSEHKLPDSLLVGLK